MASGRARSAVAAAAVVLPAPARWPTLPAGAVGQEAEGPAIDGSIRERDLQHDSRDDLYRAPTGAVPAGTPVRCACVPRWVTSAALELRLADRLGEDILVAAHASWPRATPMAASTATTTGSVGGRYRALPGDPRLSLRGPGRSGRPGSSRMTRPSTVAPARSAAPACPGRPGRSRPTTPTSRRPLGRRVRSYTRSSPTASPTPIRRNDPSPEATPGPSGAEVYRHGEVHGFPIINKGWDELPEAYCRDYKPEPCAGAGLQP